MSTVIVTGVNGFVGKHLVHELVKHGHRVIGIGREPGANAEIASSLHAYISADLSEAWPNPQSADAIIHLAGLAAVGPSFTEPQRYIEINSSMVTHMGEAYLQSSKPTPRVILVSSGAVYGSDQTMPLAEQSSVEFNSPYVVSKILMENQAAYYRKRGLDVVVARPFNHIGPGQGPGFLVPDVIDQLQRGDDIKVGNIKTKRDYTDVRDVAAAYRLLATASELPNNLYNVCSSHSVTGEKIVDLLKNLGNKAGVNVVVDESKVRPTDVADIYGDHSSLSKDTGWQPTYSLEQTLKDCLNI